MKTTCPHCHLAVDITKYLKVAPHNHGSVRCPQSGKRVSIMVHKPSAVGCSEVSNLSFSVKHEETK